MPGRVLEVQPSGFVVVEVDGFLHRLWNHDPDRVKRLVARNDGAISYQRGFGLLRTKSADGSYLFCVADFDSPKRRPCPTSPPTGTLVELLQSAGGFSIPGPEFLRLIDAETEQ